MGSVNGVVVRENIGIVYASWLYWMIRFYVEQRIHFVPTNFYFYFCQLSPFVSIFDFSTHFIYKVYREKEWIGLGLGGYLLSRLKMKLVVKHRLAKSSGVYVMV